eukprot:767205-Hanusia_phi.AAC.1
MTLVGTSPSLPRQPFPASPTCTTCMRPVGAKERRRRRRRGRGKRGAEDEQGRRQAQGPEGSAACARVTTLCVRATQGSRLRTQCHQPRGTYMSSPATDKSDSQPSKHEEVTRLGHTLQPFAAALLCKDQLKGSDKMSERGGAE